MKTPHKKRGDRMPKTERRESMGGKVRGFGLRLALMAGALMALAGCAELTATPDFKVTAATSNLTVRQGDSAQVSVLVEPSGGFQGPVSVSLEGAPSGVSVSPSTLNIGSAPSDQTLTLSVASSVAPSSYSFYLKFAASNVGEKKVRINLTVTQAASPDFTISLSPSDLQARPGGSVQTTLTLTPQNGFTGTVALTVERPNGSSADEVTLTPTSISVSGPNPVSQNLTLSVSATAQPGSYYLRLRATGGGITKEAYFTLVVSPNPSFALGVEPNSLTLSPGQSGQVNVVLVPQNGFEGTINLRLVDGDGQTFSGASLSPASFNVSGDTPIARSVTITANSNIALGNYPLKLRAESGSIAKEVRFTLTITPPPTFSLGVNPSSISGLPGETKTVTLAIAPQNGFSGTVSLQVVDTNGNPVPGFTLNPMSVDVSPDNLLVTSLQITIGSSVAPNTYALQIKGVSGSITRTASLTVTVNPPPSFALSVSPSSVTVAAGDSVNTNVIIIPQNGFSGMVNLQLVDAGGNPVPWASLTPTTVVVPEGEDLVVQQVTISVISGVAPGNYSLNIKATSGTIVRLKPITVTVQ